jgi:triosephosphate isomerase
MLQFLHMKKSIPLIVGNWKLHPATLAEAVTLASAVAKKCAKLEAPYVAVAPGYVHLTGVQKKIAKGPVSLVAQNMSTASVGAFTGEVSVLQLKDAGIEFVILGHSERRAIGETDTEIREKAELALKHRIVPIVCIGEKKRDEKGDYLGFVEKQIIVLTQGMPAAQLKKIVLAYEPIWAIGTGKTATVDDVKEMQIFIESVLTKLFDRKTAQSLRLLYGGSVKPANAQELQMGGGMDGFLVGGASLKAEDFLEIIYKSVA